jgi:hypothetical protein
VLSDQQAILITFSALNADFTAAPQSGTVPLEVSFADLSTGCPALSVWSFGDGETSTEQHPTHTYQTPGFYTVTLTLINDCGFDILTRPNYITVQFLDVGPIQWCYPEIMACVSAGIVAGYPNGTYQPGWPVSRGQMAVYVSRSLAGGDDSVPEGPLEATFSDVPTDHWAYRHIEYCAAQGVVEGYDPVTYAPDAIVTRDQMAVFIARAKGWISIGDDMATAPDLFPDVPAGFWAGSAIQACVESAVVHGYDDGHYRPGCDVTRDQMAVYISRAFNLPT